ncbi:flagellar basal body P-ring protein FlgI [Chitinivibrio alkaliphilus]|uniref:Flagellar P-ring protein n=1 Tax=Chitinivibrio alkaliphilus ACht1 TaxID=1313304 RepID=U7D8T9_9BACT|nr:flagellar basal body P-ring protein FlgI [Chitinivibrio alkaliphilus]ERP39355.1 Flagellar P-ring protein (basal body P-ring protein) [Chitinivibrio alkaliphilus ACht1]
MKIGIVIVVLLTTSVFTQEVRIRDVSNIDGLQEMQVYGYGLVVGLAGTGDRSSTVFTNQTMKNMLTNMGIELPEREINLRNVAAVMVTGTVSPFTKRGTRIDVNVASIGDARSIEGGTLLITALQGSDGEVYASAQGPLSTGGYQVENERFNRSRQNHVVVGRIPHGAIVQNEYDLHTFSETNLSISLSKPDFSSAVAMTTSINAFALADLGIDEPIARTRDAATVTLDYPRVQELLADESMEFAEFISLVENLTFTISMPARVVMNERTGTVVAGSDVRISEVAVTHGGIKVEITNRPEAVMPQPFTFGQAVTVPNPEQVVEERDMDMVVLDQNTSVTELSQALNSMGVSPRDVISIFQAIREAGALHGDLVVM